MGPPGAVTVEIEWIGRRLAGLPRRTRNRDLRRIAAAGEVPTAATVAGMFPAPLTLRVWRACHPGGTWPRR
jgi:hypothetical protein